MTDVLLGGVSLLLVACSSGPEFSDHPAAGRVVFASAGDPSFQITYLGCRGEAEGPEISVVQTDGREDWEWEVRADYAGGVGQQTNTYTEFQVSRDHGEAFAHEDELPPEEESHLDITFSFEDGDPLVVSNLTPQDIPVKGLFFASGELVMRKIDFNRWTNGSFGEPGCKDPPFLGPRNG